MRVEAQQVVEWLTARGDLETAFEIEGILPPHLDIDRDEDRQLLAQHDVEIDALLTDLARNAEHDAGAGGAGHIGPSVRHP